MAIRREGFYSGQVTILNLGREKLLGSGEWLRKVFLHSGNSYAKNIIVPAPNWVSLPVF